MVDTRLTFDRFRMRELRRKQGLSSKVLARKVKRSADHISRIENGKTPPGSDLAEKIAKVLRVTPESLWLPPGSAISSISPSGLTPSEGELVEAYRALSATHQDLIIALALNLREAKTPTQQQAAVIAAEGYQAVLAARRAAPKTASGKPGPHHRSGG